jgi:heme oxygenase
MLSQPNPLVAYTKRLHTLSHSADPSLLLAHAYVRYLGDLNGGQVIRRRVAKAYAIDVEDGSGVKFYEFKNLEGTKPGTTGDYKEIRGWYRTGMNDGVRDNEALKGKRHCYGVSKVNRLITV